MQWKGSERERERERVLRVEGGASRACGVLGACHIRFGEVSNKIKDDMIGTCSTNVRNTYKILVEKPEPKNFREAGMFLRFC
jgi:hypothetical protein